VNKLLETLLNAVSVGSLYGLIALGYTMVYGVLQFINFAHGDIVMAAAWIALLLATAAGLAAADAQPAAFASVDIGVIVFMCVLAAIRYSSLWQNIQRWPGKLPRYASDLWCIVVSVAMFRVLYIAGIWLTTATGQWAGGRDAVAAQSWSMLLPAMVVLIIVMLVAAVFGFNIERFAYRPLRKAPRLNVLITAIGMSLLIQNLGQLRAIFGTEPRSIPRLFPEVAAASIASVNIYWLDIIIVGMAILLMAALDFLVYRTRMGLAMRAVSADQPVASLMGVPVDRTISFTFIIGSALAAAGGFFYVMKYPTVQQPADTGWVLLGLKAFVAAVVGGIGNVRGAMIGGLLIGALEIFGAAYVSDAFRDVYVFGLLILVLLIKPAGIFGRHVAEKV